MKELARRLKGKTIEETLTNILEWTEENIRFWITRWPFPNVLLIFMATIVATFAIIARIFNFYSLIYLSVIVCIILLVYSLICLCIIYKFIFGHESVKSKVRKTLVMIYDTFRVGLPAEKIIDDYGLAVCRDYARLTATLLFNIYPSSKVYFLDALSHVAAAVKLGDKYYVFDQCLPILTAERWLTCHNKRKVTVYVSELLHDSEGKIHVHFEKYDVLHRQEVLISVDTKELTKKLAEELKISQTLQKAKPNFEFPLKNYALYYEDDEIVKYSLIRAIKNRLRKELCNNIHKVSKIEICQKEKDLSVKVYLN